MIGGAVNEVGAGALLSARSPVGRAEDAVDGAFVSVAVTDIEGSGAGFAARQRSGEGAGTGLGACTAGEGACVIGGPLADNTVGRAGVGIAFAGVKVSRACLATVQRCGEFAGAGLGAFTAGLGAGRPSIPRSRDAVNGAALLVASNDVVFTRASLAAEDGGSETAGAGLGAAAARVGAFVKATPSSDFTVNGALLVVARTVLTIFLADLATEDGVAGGTGAELGASLARLGALGPFGPAEVHVVGEAALNGRVTVEAVLRTVVAVAVLADLGSRASLATVHGFLGETGTNLGRDLLVGKGDVMGKVLGVPRVFLVAVIASKRFGRAGARAVAGAPRAPRGNFTVNRARVHVAFLFLGSFGAKLAAKCGLGHGALAVLGTGTARVGAGSPGGPRAYFAISGAFVEVAGAGFGLRAFETAVAAGNGDARVAELRASAAGLGARRPGEPFRDAVNGARDGVASHLFL